MGSAIRPGEDYLVSDQTGNQWRRPSIPEECRATAAARQLRVRLMDGRQLEGQRHSSAESAAGASLFFIL